MNVLVLEKYPTKYDYFKLFSFTFDRDALVQSKKDKVLKADITFDFSTLDSYDVVILVGADPVKFMPKCKGYNVTTHQGYLIGEKFIPLPSPYLPKLKPAAAPEFDKAVERINEYVDGSYSFQKASSLVDVCISQDEDTVVEYLKEISTNSTGVVAMDTENTSLYARTGHNLGISLAYNEDKCFYISSDAINEEAEQLLFDIAKNNTVVFHNSKYDIEYLNYHYGLKFPRIEDTMLMHYMLDENSEHGLKPLAIKYTNLGDYDSELSAEKKRICKARGIAVGDFDYGMFDFEVLATYGAIDASATMKLYNKFKDSLVGSVREVYYDLLLPASEMLRYWESVGVPISKANLEKATRNLNKRLSRYRKLLYSYKEVQEYREQEGGLNTNSPVQLRKFFFDFMGLPETNDFTSTGAHSTDESVLIKLAEHSNIPKLMLKIKKTQKLLNTYIYKIASNLDTDGRLRTRFNLHTTTSGRLSSSGTINMQQLPRDDKTVKNIIAASEGYKILSVDVQTGEMYVVAVLSGDKKLQQSFKDGVDFHSYIAQKVFKLDCEVSEVRDKYKHLRSAAKAISFGILYGSGPATVARESGVDVEEAKEYIKEYFDTFPQLRKWIDTKKEIVQNKGCIYSAIGRKRRVRNVFSDDRETSGHAMRSAINFLVQSVLSDLVVKAALKMHSQYGGADWYYPFALVHDSLLAEVREDKIEECKALIRECFVFGENFDIPGCPMGLDFEVGDSYAFK